MSDEIEPEGRSTATESASAKRSMGPFDHPWFLPGLLYAFAVWFGYDGWLNPNIKSVTFNRVMAPLWLAGAIYYTIQNLRDQRRRREAARPPEAH
ncbi:MAG: hypothetical protein IT386_17880 [Deltaproteobacteria bacterium]|nr:hypothetical protein [Deltaproteobacteria bacterium]